MTTAEHIRRACSKGNPASGGQSLGYSGPGHGVADSRILTRHSFASRALAIWQSLPMIGWLLGHSEVQITERYAHLAADWVRESAVRISENIATEILHG